MRIIQGDYKGRQIKTISGPGYRPATGKVRQAIFSMLEARGIEWSQVRGIDLFAGSGILGIEALSRGVQEMWFVEKNSKAAQTIQDSLLHLEVPKQYFRVISYDVLSLLKKKNTQPFQLIFIDPPYRKELFQPVMERLVSPVWIAEPGFIVAEVESHLDISFSQFSGLDLCINRTYGQTRVCLWTVKSKR
jgi:16S rRNA (guanine966-N2)-methyltransferase